MDENYVFEVTTNLDQLETQIKEWMDLPYLARIQSDSLCRKKYGMNTFSLYQTIKKSIKEGTAVDPESFTFGIQEGTIGVVSHEQLMEYGPPIQTILEKKEENDKIGLLVKSLDYYSDMNIMHRAMYKDYLLPKIHEAIYQESYSLPDVVPYFTVSEMEEMGIQMKPVSNYSKALRETMDLYTIGEATESDVLSLGWNPSVPITEKNLKFAKARQEKWFQEYGCHIIDISKLEVVESIQESTAKMINMYQQYGLYPVYIVLSYTETPFGHVIRAVKRCVYTHSSLALDSSLNDMVSFTYEISGDKGLTIETLKTFTDKTLSSLIDVMCVFVDISAINKIKEVISFFKNNKKKTSYNFFNLFNIVLNRAVNSNGDLSLVCSQFVDTILKIANINIVTKSSNLVIPEDFKRMNHPKVFKLYEGLAIDYDESKVEKKIHSLFKSLTKDSLSFSKLMESVYGTSLVDFRYIKETKETEQVFQEITSLLTPTPVILEKKFPIEFTKEGDLVIELIKSLEQQYQEAHRLLKSYDETNLEGIKHELARLYYVNYEIEKKIKKMKKDDENYKKLIDLRARVLNDFKKYFKIVIKQEPDFDFAAYYQKSEYYNGNIIIDNSVLKFTGRLIKKFLESLGF